MRIARIERERAAVYWDMVFAGMRENLSRVSADGPHLALAALKDEEPAGLVYGEIDAARTGHVRSLFVRGAQRRKGIGSALVSALEAEFARLECARVQMAFMTEKPSTEAVECLLRRQGWDDPVPDTLFCKIDERMLNWPVYQRQGWLIEDLSLFDWADLTAADREYILRSQAESPWIPEDLVPFQYEENFERLNSLGIRYKGRPVGWMITHRVSPDTIRYTCSFITDELQRRFRIVPIYQEAYRRQHAAGFPYALFMVPYRHEAMVKFTKRHWVGKYGVGWESRIAGKTLAKSSGWGLAHAS